MFLFYNQCAVIRILNTLCAEPKMNPAASALPADSGGVSERITP